MNYLLWDTTGGTIVHMFYGIYGTHLELEWGRFSGNYGVAFPPRRGQITWRQYNFDSNAWLERSHLLL